MNCADCGIAPWQACVCIGPDPGLWGEEREAPDAPDTDDDDEGDGTDG